MTQATRTPEPFPWHCGRCGAEKVFPEKIAYDTTLRYEGRDYQIVVPELPALKCQDCGEVLLNDESDSELSRAFRDQLKLLQPETIREGRKRFNLNQREFAEPLGFAEESVSRWETGAQMQSRVVDKIMRVYFASPEAREVLDAAKTDANVGTSVVTTEDIAVREPAGDWREALRQTLTRRIAGLFESQHWSEISSEVDSLWSATAAFASHAHRTEISSLTNWLQVVDRDFRTDPNARFRWRVLRLSDPRDQLDARIADRLGSVADRLQSLPAETTEPLVENFERLLDIWPTERAGAARSP